MSDSDNDYDEFGKDCVLESLWAEDSQTPEICLAAVRANGFELEFVRNQTFEICLAAVMQDGRALRFVWQTPKNTDLVLAALTQNAYAIVWHWDDFDERVAAAVLSNAEALDILRERPGLDAIWRRKTNPIVVPFAYLEAYLDAGIYAVALPIEPNPERL